MTLPNQTAFATVADGFSFQTNAAAAGHQYYRLVFP